VCGFFLLFFFFFVLPCSSSVIYYARTNYTLFNAPFFFLSPSTTTINLGLACQHDQQLLSRKKFNTREFGHFFHETITSTRQGMGLDWIGLGKKRGIWIWFGFHAAFTNMGATTTIGNMEGKTWEGRKGNSHSHTGGDWKLWPTAWEGRGYYLFLLLLLFFFFVVFVVCCVCVFSVLFVSFVICAGRKFDIVFFFSFFVVCCFCVCCWFGRHGGGGGFVSFGWAGSKNGVPSSLDPFELCLPAVIE
jgi:hypothetical protein